MLLQLCTDDIWEPVTGTFNPDWGWAFRKGGHKKGSIKGRRKSGAQQRNRYPPVHSVRNSGGYTVIAPKGTAMTWPSPQGGVGGAGRKHVRTAPCSPENLSTPFSPESPVLPLSIGAKSRGDTGHHQSQV